MNSLLRWITRLAGVDPAALPLAAQIEGGRQGRTVLPECETVVKIGHAEAIGFRQPVPLEICQCPDPRFPNNHRPGSTALMM